MIYLFAGDDTKKKLTNYEDFMKSLPTSTELFSIGRNNFNKTQIESLYSGSGLFFNKSAAIFEGILEREAERDFIMDKLPIMGESANMFVFIESKLSKPVLDAFKKSRAQINIFELPKEKKEKYDSFKLANAFAAKDKLNLWIYFREASTIGVAMEELTGVIFWKIKDMILRKNFSKFTEEELKKSAAKLSYLLPEALKEGRDAEAAMEQFLLEVF
jgi:hypothetical protein